MKGFSKYYYTLIFYEYKTQTYVIGAVIKTLPPMPGSFFSETPESPRAVVSDGVPRAGAVTF